MTPTKNPAEALQGLNGEKNNPVASTRLLPDKHSLPRKAALVQRSFAMANKLPRDKQIEVLHHLIEGNTLRSTARLTKVHRTTIQDLLVSFGQKCQAFMDSKLRGLTLQHLECDEIW